MKNKEALAILIIAISIVIGCHVLNSQNAKTPANCREVDISIRQLGDSLSLEVLVDNAETFVEYLDAMEGIEFVAAFEDNELTIHIDGRYNVECMVDKVRTCLEERIR